MSIVLKAYDKVCNTAQEFMDTTVPVRLPRGILRATVNSFILSFTVSTIFSGGNVAVGALGGAIGALAAVITTVAHVALQQLQNAICRWLKEPIIPLNFEGKVLASVIGMVGAVACGDVTGIIKPMYSTLLIIAGLTSLISHYNNNRDFVHNAIAIIV
jgi:hypothetical protein